MVQPFSTQNGVCSLHSLHRCLSSSTAGPFGYGVLGVADATGYLHLFQLREDRDLHLSPWCKWKMNEETALCLSLDWSDRTSPTPASDTSLVVSQSNGKLATVPSLECGSAGNRPSGLETWIAHDYEAWIAAWDCYSQGSILWSGT